MWFDDVDYQLSLLEEVSDRITELRDIPPEYESSYELLGTFEKTSSKYTMLYRRKIRQINEVFAETLIEYDKIDNILVEFLQTFEDELQVKY